MPSEPAVGSRRASAALFSLRRIEMRRLVGLVGLALMAESVIAQGQPTPASPSEEVWRWFDECSPRQTMHLEVLLDGESVYSATFPACAVHRDVPDTSRLQKLTFVFLAQTGIFGEQHATPGARSIEGTIWKAGSDHDALLLGVLFLVGNQILSSKIHVADPHRESQSSLGTGLMIETSAVGGRNSRR